MIGIMPKRKNGPIHTQIAMRAYEDTLKVLEPLADAERRSLANMCEVLILEALKARGLIAD